MGDVSREIDVKAVTVTDIKGVDNGRGHKGLKLKHASERGEGGLISRSEQLVGRPWHDARLLGSWLHVGG